MSYVLHFRNRTELADPQALFTFTHPNRGECLKLILLSRRIWTNIWHEFDRNADRQQPLWSSKIYYEMRLKCDSMLHGFAGYFDYWTLDVSRNCCSCQSSVFTLQKMAVQVNVIYFPRVSTYLTINYIIIYLWLYFDLF